MEETNDRDTETDPGSGSTEQDEPKHAPSGDEAASDGAFNLSHEDGALAKPRGVLGGAQSR
jgi:hypothetical protein